MSAPAAIKAKLAALRESFLHTSGVQDWISQWWDGIGIDDRRLLLALAGLDESAMAARRSWNRMKQEDRDTLMAECKRVGRLVDAMRWA